MKWHQNTGLRYALLLVVLLATATVAVVVTLGVIEQIIPKDDFHMAAAAIWALTMGFMLIAGAFGLWAISFAAEAESLRRLGSLVDAMDYIRDGVVGMDRQGRATGMNPAAIAIFGEAARQQKLTAFCPSVLQQDLDEVLQSASPVEFEHEVGVGDDRRTLRFRSQPAKGIILLLVSDVTSLARDRARRRRAAYLHLVGHMAQGIANDFNDLLCGIVGHASLMTRHNGKAEDTSAAAAAIQNCANRGILLARHLIELAGNSGDAPMATAQTARHIHAGIDLLQDSLHASWMIERRIDPDIPPVNLPAAQLEHLVHSLGLLAADASPAALQLTIALSAAVPGPSPRSSSMPAAVLRIAALPADELNDRLGSPQNTSSTGVIASVVDSLLSQAGGRLRVLATAEGAPVYEITLPEADPATLAAEDPGALVHGLEAYIARWHILIDRNLNGADACMDYLRRTGVHTTTASGIAELLASIEKDEKLDAIVLNAKILGQDRSSILKAIAKLSGSAGIVVQQPDAQEGETVSGVVCISDSITPAILLHAIIEARSRMRGARQGTLPLTLR